MEQRLVERKTRNKSTSATTSFPSSSIQREFNFNDRSHNATIGEILLDEEKKVVSSGSGLSDYVIDEKNSVGPFYHFHLQPHQNYILISLCERKNYSYPASQILDNKYPHSRF